MEEHQNDTTDEFELPARRVARLEEVAEGHRCLYIREGNGFALRPEVAANIDRMERDYRLVQVEHERQALKKENIILKERYRRLQQEADSAAGGRVVQTKPAELEKSFSAQLERLKSGLVH